MSGANRPPVEPGQIWRDRRVKDRYLRCIEVRDGGAASSLPYYSPYGEATFEGVEFVNGRWIARVPIGCRKQSTLKINASGAPKSSAFVLHEQSWVGDA